MFRNDISFCLHNNCPHVKCMRYITKAPRNEYYSAFAPKVDANWDCKYRFDDEWETVEDVKHCEED